VLTNKENVSITADGKLSVTGIDSPDPINPSQLYIAVRNGNDSGTGQFVITDADSDGDIMVDSYERRIGRNPSVADDIKNDRDGDGLSDLAEAYLRTDPNKKDTDGDSYDDNVEVKAKSDPLDQNSYPDSQ
jgi:hypothetical protein